jgi:hypothetical protein
MLVKTAQGRRLTQDLVDALNAYAGYRNRASKELLRNVANGRGFPDAAPPDNEAHSLVKVPIVVARYAGELKALHLNANCLCHFDAGHAYAYPRT